MDPTLRPLPTPRHLLTSLINTLTTPPPPAPAPPSTQPPTINTPYPHASKETTTNQNPLRNLPASHRALLTTLHVLFPPGMVLQSLDLLDRGLVTRIICVPSPSQAHPTSPREGETAKDLEREEQVWPPQANIHLPPETLNNAIPEEKERGKNNVIYRVSSSQPQKSRFSHSYSGAGTGTGQVYTVRLKAWNCSCAAFAFSAFPAAYSSRPWELEREYGDEETGGKRGDEGEEEEWEFGDGCLDGLQGEGVPVCKHLLACLLGERWGSVVGGLVKEREVGREEMAGLGAE
ncbi:hypothetical protein HYFRA_00008606 [Hymenoscyphus fraxineus]|uniref:SWIM-type domain-containing protein n=1 Tax=Hymenoscyphus fraxineus TaxID=746836 RepID=A0A9N9KY47_9HELO|nr:hypothetical protein HYFRA_00008606 [Hymenoscyphus fraxineus]